MDSTILFGRAKCKRNATGKVCTCQEWVPSEDDKSLCECCEHHMSFHEPLHPIALEYGRCLRQCDDARFSHEDGCQEFCPSCASNPRISCAGCGCHRNFHEKVTVVAGELAGPSNVHFQQQDSLSGDPSTSLLRSSSKRIRRDPTITRTDADPEHERAPGSGHDLANESDLADLEAKHKVFLSHSGAQKDFVEQLCVDLERCDRYPFFDKLKSSLPVGKEFPPRLFAAIRQAEVGVAVLSEDFFSRTKWPMLELVEMMRVSERLGARMSIVPVFLGISRDSVFDSQSQERWMERWKEWAKDDQRIDIEKWKSALRDLKPIGSLSLKDGEVSLRKEVVDAVCELVLPESRWDDSNVEGKDRLCQVILDKVDLEGKAKDQKVRVVGLYGIGGIGKTTICKVLCNKLFKQFRGRVCHTELKTASEAELLREVLKILTDRRHSDLEGMNVDKCKDQLRRSIVKQPIFLAIDNVDENSAEQAKTYLRVAAEGSFKNGSVVVVTSRSLLELQALGIPKDDCLGMPELELGEVMELFRNSAKSIGDVEYELDERIISRCVQMCRFNKDGESYHYHPLALKVLGNEVREQMACNNFDPTLWYSRFSRIEKPFGVLETKKQIFSILRISYDALSPEDKMLFMDVALFMRTSIEDIFELDFDWPDVSEWLGMVHGPRETDKFEERLRGLKRKSLLEKVGDRSTDLVMHDLWREFCVAETEAGTFAERRWVYFKDGCKGLGESNPSGLCWENLERMYFMSEAGVQKFLELDLKYFSNVKLLIVEDRLVATGSRPRVVDLGKMIHLKYLEISHFEKYERFSKPGYVSGECEVCGLQSLTQLAFLQWSGMPGEAGYAEDIGCLTNLLVLKLRYCRGETLPDMTKLTSLRMAVFKGGAVQTIRGLTGNLSNLQSLNLADCEELRSCPGVGDLVGLVSLDISGCTRLEELPNLGKLTNLTDLNMKGCSSLRVCPGLCGLRKLLRMDISSCSLWSTLPSLSDLVSLEELCALDCSNLAEFPDMRNLKNLRVLNILGCPVKALPGFEGLIALLELKANFQLSEDRFRDGVYEGMLEVRDLINIPGLQKLTVTQCSLYRMGMMEPVCGLRLMNRNGPGDSEVVSHLSVFRGLQELYVSGYRPSTSEKQSEWQSFIKVLDLSSFPRCFPHLEKFDLRGFKSLIQISSKEPWRGLKILKLWSCVSLKSLPDLSCFPDLESLGVGDCRSLIRISSKEPLHPLKNLKLWRNVGPEPLPDLSSFLDLEALRLIDCQSLIRISSGRQLRALKILKLWRCNRLDVLQDLSSFPNLESLCLRACEKLTSVHTSVPLLALEDIDLGGCISLTDLPDLSNFTSLRSLDLEMCESLVSLTSSEPLPALCSLNAKRCRSLKALPDHLCSSVKLQYLGVKGSGIQLSEDTVNELLASCVELKSVKTSARNWGEDSGSDASYEDWDEWHLDYEDERLDNDSE